MTTLKSIGKFLALAVSIALTFFILFYVAQTVRALIATDVPTNANRFQQVQFFASTTVPTATAATSTSATSTNITGYFDSSGRLDNGSLIIAGAKKATVYFTRGGAFGSGSGTTTFSVQVSPDGTNWYTFSQLADATSSTNANVIERSTVTLYGATSTATTTTVENLDLTYGAWLSARCVAVVLGNNSAQCDLGASF